VPTFAYRGHGPAGAVSGRVEAPDRRTATRLVRARGIALTRLEESRARTARWQGRIRVKDVDLALYTRQLSTMIHAGLPIAQCLTILAEQAEGSALRRITALVAAEVAGGTALAEAVGKHPRVFGGLFTHMLEVGEAAGALDTTLARLSTYLAKSSALKRKVRGAMIYPLSVVGVAALVVAFMLGFVIPTFAQMFASFGAELPRPTRIVIALSDFVRAYLVAMAASGAALAVGLRRFTRTERGRAIADRLVLKVPVLAPLVRKVAIARVTRTLGTLIACGVPILEGLRITARTAGNRVVEHAILQTRAALVAGRTLTEPLRGQVGLPPMVVQMVHIGEQTGSMDEMLAAVADFFDDEVDAAVANLTTLLEPAVIVILGLVIGGLVVAMYLPIFKLVTVIR
jgi:type IV pilus assembly protein PilC